MNPALQALPPGPALLAVSGGLDSMVLLHLYRKLRPADSFQVAHVHHGVRGADADADAELVRAACEQAGVTFHLLRLDASALHGSGGFEARARAARYAALQNLRARLGLSCLVTAHHRDDQAETLCLRIMRGTSLKGLQGILAQREDAVVRPLLNWGRADLKGYALCEHVTWREDATNASPDFARNRVRHALLPALEKTHPGIAAQMARLADLSQSAWPVLMQRLETFFGDSRLSTPFPVQFFAQMPHRMLILDEQRLRPLLKHWELFKLWLGGQGFSWSRTTEEARLRQALLSGRPDRMQTGDVRMERSDGRLWWMDTRNWSCASDNMYLFCMLRNGSKEPCASPVADSSAWLRADLVADFKELELRLRRPGDRFSPPGMRSGRRKLKQWLQECGIPPSWRNCLQVVAKGRDVVWIPGFGVSGLAKPDPGANHVLELRIEWKKNP